MLLAAFIIWLAVNDRLQAYTAVLFGPTQQPTPAGNISDKNNIIAAAPIAAPTATSPAGLLPDESNIIDSTATNAPNILEEALPALLEFL